MLTRWVRPTFAVPVAGILCFTCLSTTAHAWQFRDLDQDEASSVVEEVESGLLELVPTNQAFTAPPTEKKVVELTEVLVQPAPPEKPAAVEAAPAPQVAVDPVPEKKKTPAPEKSSVVAGPEPIPMPELSVAEKAEVPAVPENPFELFGSKKDADGDVYTLDFAGIQAGVTKSEKAIEQLGEPVRTVEHEDGSKSLLYRHPAFKQVEITTTDDVVSAVLVHLPEAAVVADLAGDLSLDEFDTVPVPDEFGEVLGQAYPERGVLFSYTGKPDAFRVSAILIEPVSAEMFRLRAQYDFGHNYERSIADLDSALTLDPMDADSHWLRAEYLDSSGQTRDGLKSAQKAVRLKPTNPVYRITRSRLLAKTSRRDTAVAELKELIQEVDMTPDIAARAHKLLGDLLAIGPKADHQEALKHHLKSIDFGSRAVDDRRFAIRRAAKHILVTAHMSVARDIAMGNFQRQSDVVPKWLLRATELADEFIADDQGDELLQMQIFRDTLASYSELQQGKFDAAVATEEALKTARDMIANATDEAYKAQIERILAETMLQAARIHRARGKYDSAMQFANNGIALLGNSEDEWESTAHDRYLEAQLSFVIGSIHAIRDQDHEQAVEWYAKARSTFVASNFASPLYSNRGHGEMYVSMGLSYWETGEQQKAVKITQTGAELMKQAVETGSLQLQAMTVPYGNLATMHNKLGQDRKSQEYAKLVARLEDVSTKKR